MTVRLHSRAKPRHKDRTGMRYGRLVVVELAATQTDRHARWVCRCDCGKRCVVSAAALRDGMTKSCGCLRRESARRNGAASSARAAELADKRSVAPTRAPTESEQAALDLAAAMGIGRIAP